MTWKSKILRSLLGAPKRIGASNAVFPRSSPNRLIFAIGDIHGDIENLRRVHEWIDAYKKRIVETVEIYVGDYIDRGKYSKSVIETLLARKFDTPCVFLRGNHEDMLLELLEGRLSPAQWRTFGGNATLIDYGIDAQAIADAEVPAALRAAMPINHLKFLATLPYYHEEAGYVFVHAGVKPKIKLDHQLERDLLWIREPFLEYRGKFEAIVVHGHTPVPEPEFYSNRINIDTGAHASGHLTALAIGEHGIEVFTT